MNKFYVKTLGCRLNQAESQELAAKLLAAGWQETNQPAEADLIVLNSCVVTRKAEREVRQAIRQLRAVNPKAKLVVAGCWADKVRRFGGKVPPGIDQLLGNKEKWDLGKLVSNEKLKVNSYLIGARGLIWVQKGCGNQCSYCLTRLVRGRPVSRPIEEVIDQVRTALRAGAKEIVLTGQNLSQYWYQNQTWLDLIEQVLEQTSVELLRLGSVNPMLVEIGNRDYLSAAKRLVAIYQGVGRGRLARHLHLSLQSGSNRILKLMRRNYLAEKFLEVVNILRRGVKGINLTTDIIVGFPGETDEDFQKTLDLAQQAKFGKIHIFRYSSREGTLAAKMESEWGRVEEKVKKARAQQLSQLEKKLRHQFWQSQIGQTAKAIIWLDNRGLTDNYLPIFLENSSSPLPMVSEVKLIGLEKTRLKATLHSPQLLTSIF